MYTKEQVDKLMKDIKALIGVVDSNQKMIGSLLDRVECLEENEECLEEDEGCEEKSPNSNMYQ